MIVNKKLKVNEVSKKKQYIFTFDANLKAKWKHCRKYILQAKHY